MTYKDILDTLVSTAGDKGSAYRTQAVLWLNLVRQDCVAMGSWKSAKNSASTVTTDPNNTTGVYALTGIDEVVGGEMYDLTAHNRIKHDTENQILRFEVGINQFGPPVLWADSGMTPAGEKQVRFWPIPDDARDIGFIGCKALTDITTANEAVTIDPYFGPLTACGTMLSAGLNWYRAKDDNEDVASIAKAEGTFTKMIQLVSGQAGIDPNSSTRLEPVNRRQTSSPRGRFDPGHYGNG